jgi:hypothetical protein
MDFKGFTEFGFKTAKIAPQGKSEAKDFVPITTLINSFNYVENVTTPFLSASLEVVDSGGLLQGLPIKGAETVQIEVTTNLGDFTYEFVVWKVANRFIQNKKQVYTLGLISPEALNNEILRMEQALSGNPSNIIANILEDTLKTKKDFNRELAKFDVKMIPNSKRPFDVAASLAVRSVSPQGKYEEDTSSAGDTQSTTGRESKNAKGSGGFFFWESKRGYNFYAVDTLCADENSELKSKEWKVEPHGPYIERMANQDDADERFLIYKSVFSGELDLLASLRKGKYSSFLAFFNHSTGQYEEYVYRIKDSYDNMAHLGGQEGINLIPTSKAFFDQEVKLSDYPTRRMSILLDHETWYNDAEIASPDEGDGSESPTQFADWQKYYSAQAIARYELLKNQKCSIVIPGNANICAGDTVDIRLQSKLPDAQAKENPYDQESSGIYLIEEVTHEYDRTVGSNGRFLTTLRLMRDSYGMKDKQSKHGSK